MLLYDVWFGQFHAYGLLVGSSRDTVHSILWRGMYCTYALHLSVTKKKGEGWNVEEMRQAGTEVSRQSDTATAGLLVLSFDFFPSSSSSSSLLPTTVFT